MTYASPPPGADSSEWYAQASVPRGDRPVHLGHVLWSLVAVLGVGIFGVALAGSVSSETAVPLAVLAGAVAAVRLLPGQHDRGWPAPPLAIAASLGAVAMWVGPDVTSWIQPTTVALAIAQAVTAVVALLLDARARNAEAEQSAAERAAYAQAAQAYQAYAAQYHMATTFGETAQGHANAHADAHHDAYIGSDGYGSVDDPAADLASRYAGYGADAQPQHTKRSLPAARHENLGTGAPHAGTGTSERYSRTTATPRHTGDESFGMH